MFAYCHCSDVGAEVRAKEPVVTELPERSKQDRSAEIQALRAEILGLQAQLEEAGREMDEVGNDHLCPYNCSSLIPWLVLCNVLSTRTIEALF